MRRRFLLNITPPLEFVKVRSIIYADSQIVQDKILVFDVKQNQAIVNGDNPVVGRGTVTGSWQFELLTTEGLKAVTVRYNCWTVSNGDVWIKEVALTPDNPVFSSGSIRCSSRNLLNFNSSIKTVQI